MILAAPLETWLDPSPAAAAQAPRRSHLVLLAFALLSWTLAEVLMAPVLKALILWLWVGYAASFFLFAAWYYRLSRFFASRWERYGAGLSPLAWALAPLHLAFPTALLAMHAGATGVLVYEVVKAGIILAVIARLGLALRELNQWPPAAALALVVSPLLVVFVGVVFMAALGGLGAVVLGLAALAR